MEVKLTVKKKKSTGTPWKVNIALDELHMTPCLKKKT